MKKRIFALFVALILCLCILPLEFVRADGIGADECETNSNTGDIISNAEDSRDEMTDPAAMRGTNDTGYFLIGSFSDWGINTDYQMTQNPNNGAEYMILAVYLPAGAQIKGSYADNGSITYYPDGEGNHYTINDAGYYDVFLRPDGQGAGWHYGYLYVQATETKTITYAAMSYGTVTGPSSAAVSTPVTLTVTPVSGYGLIDLTVSTGSGTVATTPGANNTYTFNMPADDVTVSATFGQKHTYATYSGTTLTLSYSASAPDTYVASDFENTGYPFDYFSNRAKVTRVAIDPSFAQVRPTTLEGWFSGFAALTSITGMDNLNTSAATSMGWMFSRCNNLSSLDLSHFDTSNVTNMSSMFSSCSALTSIDVSRFNTTNVTLMPNMFTGLAKVTQIIGLTSFNTGAVKDFSAMFFGCAALTALGVSHFDTHSATDMNGMFSGCSKLTSIDVSGFNTRNVKSLSSMFSSCGKLTSVNMNGQDFVTDKVTNFSSMFAGCSSIITIDLSHISTAAGQNFNSMFENCTQLTALNLSGFSTQSMTQTTRMFFCCTGLTELDLTSFTDANLTKTDYMFYGCTNLRTIWIDSSKWTKSSVSNSSYMFSNNTALVGENGTVFDSNHKNYDYAHVDTAGNPGYMSTFHFVTIAATEHGSLAVNDSASSPVRVLTRKTVTLTVTPDSGYVLDTLTAAKDGAAIQIAPVANETGKYTFEMPAGDVTVTASFIENNGPVICNANVYFEGMIHLSFGFNQATLPADGYIRISKAGANNNNTVKTVPVTNGTLKDGYLEFYLPVMIPEFADLVTVQVLDANQNALFLKSKSGTDYGTTGFVYSVKQYAENKKVNGATPEMRALAQALLDYGTAAQINFQYGDYQSLSVRPEVTQVTAEMLNAFALVTTPAADRPEGVTANIRVYFESNNTLRITFSGLSSGTNYTYTLDNESVTPANSFLEKENIAAPNLDVSHDFTISDGNKTFSITASALSYALTSIQYGNEARQNLGKALYLYCQAANAFFQNSN